MTFIHDLPAYAGLNTALCKDLPYNEDIQNDLEGEKETIPDLSSRDSAPSENPTVFLWRKTISGASKGVSEKTDSEYQRLVNQCVNFLIGNSLIQKREDFVCPSPSEDVPFFITAWIMNQCDEINLDGSLKPQNQIRDSYVHGQKMRASMTYLFGHILGLGSRPWQKSEVTGRMTGNPSISEQVSSYMMSLRTRKVHSSETPTSAHAVTSETLKKLYDENNKPEKSKIKEYEPSSRSQAQDINDWGGDFRKTHRDGGKSFCSIFVHLTFNS
ncbi:hypothetical protein CPB84DRAFT_1934166 [Gymnopilus junonius]|uniref:Uncharacterized protein n=1 Tax=Gymnopilus junonius TaxID=109634 RepID=A0A9P5N7R4_GYMJU|nr:hypothetical protein CPB84DRAFT_1934166 [Gymnopilus junonius]